MFLAFYCASPVVCLSLLMLPSPFFFLHCFFSCFTPLLCLLFLFMLPSLPLYLSGLLLSFTRDLPSLPQSFPNTLSNLASQGSHHLDTITITITFSPFFSFISARIPHPNIKLSRPIPHKNVHWKFHHKSSPCYESSEVWMKFGILLRLRHSALPIQADCWRSAFLPSPFMLLASLPRELLDEWTSGEACIMGISERPGCLLAYRRLYV